MELPLDVLTKTSILIKGNLIGIHAILRPSDDRIVAVILSNGFRMYTLYIRQSDPEHLELHAEEAPLKCGA